jgi:ArsR family transcriptional regulator
MRLSVKKRGHGPGSDNVFLTLHINVWLYDNMKEIERTLKLLSDTTRLRILMLLDRRELCVCQVMGVLGVSQPLVSRNLNLMRDAGFVSERREGKLVFYALNKKMPAAARKIIGSLKEVMKTDRTLAADLESLRDCEEFQRKTGTCDMKTFTDFMSKRRKKARE